MASPIGSYFDQTFKEYGLKSVTFASICNGPHKHCSFLQRIFEAKVTDKACENKQTRTYLVHCPKGVDMDSTILTNQKDTCVSTILWDWTSFSFFHRRKFPLALSFLFAFIYAIFGIPQAVTSGLVVSLLVLALLQVISLREKKTTPAKNTPNMSSDHSKSNPKTSVPLLICIHGTDEVMFDCEFMRDSKNGTSILDWSDENGAVLVCPQAVGHWGEPYTSPTWRPPNDKLRTLFSLSIDEFRYFEHVIDDAKKIIPAINMNRIYVWGFSNGAFIVGYWALHSRGGLVFPGSEGSGSLKEPWGNGYTFKHKIRSICIYQGGISENIVYALGCPRLKLLPEISEIELEGPRRKKLEDGSEKEIPKIFVVSGTREQRASKLAWQFFHALGFYVKYFFFTGDHAVNSDYTTMITDFLQGKGENKK